MTSPFKIPRRTPSDSDSVQMTSPLSRLQGPDNGFKTFSPFKDRTLSGNSPSLNTHRGSSNSLRIELKSRIGPKPAEASFSIGWRPKRASDRLLAPLSSVSPLSPVSPQKTTSSTLSDQSPSLKPISVRSVDCLAKVRAEQHRGSSPLSDRNRKLTMTQEKPNKIISSSSKPNSDAFSSSSSDKTSEKPASETKAQNGWSDLSDIREKQREKWRQFKEKKQSRSSAALRPTRTKSMAGSTNSTEPIVLSSEEEEEQNHINQSVSSGNTQVAGSVSDRLSEPLPSFLQLDFRSFHMGLLTATANGKIMITENGITVPLRGDHPGSEAEICVVSNQVQGYGLWDSCDSAHSPHLSTDSAHSPSGPFLLFLWVSEAQAKLLQTELRDIHLICSDPVCCYLVLVLKEPLSDLDSALLLSVLDTEDYRKSRSRPCPLDQSEGLGLVHTCDPPVELHLLNILGQRDPCRTHKNQQKSTPVRSTRTGLRSTSQQLPIRLIQYPRAPSKGRISVSSEDLLCLNQGEFLNDVIIDFYLKYLLLEGVGGAVAEKSHIFSSFFYKQLSKRRAAGEDDVASVPDRHTRHQRVKTWTRNIDIFNKHYLFVPVNQESHWFLVVVCFPGIENVTYEDFICDGCTLRSQTPECTQKGCRKNEVLKRPCILVMDSLKLSHHENVCRLLRDYLQVEWEVRRGSRRLFSPDSVKSCNCRVPLQDNSSDCGLYLLQYVQSFLQNPVVDFELPVRLESWFLRQQVWSKRQEIRSLVLRLHQEQN